jgi:glycosyltransferase involved in cell wall biosynthesis
MPPKVIVIIPTLNRAETCKRALKSLLNQSYKNWHLVIAKNGWMTDFKNYTKQLNHFLPKSNVSMLILPRKGLGYALNEASRAFLNSAKYFAILEDDDEWDKEFLTTMVNALDNNNNADIAHCMQIQKPKQIQSNGAPVDISIIRRQNYINFPMCLFRTVLFDKLNGFCDEAGPATDWDWHLRNLKSGSKYLFIEKQLVTHHWHGSNYCLEANNDAFIRKRFEDGIYG